MEKEMKNKYKIMNILIFDIGGVLNRFRWRELLADLGYDQEQTEAIGKAVFLSPLWHEFDRGILSDEQIIAQMIQVSPQYTSDINRIFQEENFQNVSRVLPYSEELICSLHEKGCKIYILSNYGESLMRLKRREYSFLDYVDGSVFSYAVHQMKPEDAIYQTLLKKYDIQPENALFFDDKLENCEAAMRNGIQSVQVKGMQSILDGLKEYCGIELTF